MKAAFVLWIAAALAGTGRAAAQPVESTATLQALVRGENAFACELYGRLAAQPGNVLFSPFSVHQALAMSYLGARGATASEMKSVLHFPIEGRGLGLACRDLTRQILPPAAPTGRKPPVEIETASALWGRAGEPFDRDFRALLESAFGAPLRQADFARGDEARDGINAWAAARTHGRIRDLVPAGALNSRAVAVLVNAIYFHALWDKKFASDETMPAEFHLTPWAQIMVPTMSQTLGAWYLETPALQVLDLPYGDHRTTMTILLPRSVDGLPALERHLSADSLTFWLGRVEMHRVEVHLPRFQIAGGCQLVPALSRLGMPRAFDEQADFTGMSPAKPLFISGVFHQAFVMVEEEGTEAAAASAIVHYRGVSPDEVTPLDNFVFRADHPFLFLIRHVPTGAVLFIGRVADPR
jgi:serpin B